MKIPTHIQTINDSTGKPVFAVIPYDDYLALINPKIKEEFLVPNEVVQYMTKHNCSVTRSWREYLHLTQKELAERMEITQSAYAQLENSNKLRKSSREKIAAALGIDEQLLDV